uniref:Uncharacterized protein n=1 Tax=Arundo donax TaxID=35708 RepID=A0A0A9C2R0_ARUDO
MKMAQQPKKRRVWTKMAAPLGCGRRWWRRWCACCGTRRTARCCPGAGTPAPA